MVFEANRLFKVGHIPADMKGNIEILSQETNTNDRPQTLKSETHLKTETTSNQLQRAETAHQPLHNESFDPFDISNEQQTETVNNYENTETAKEPGELYTPLEDNPPLSSSASNIKSSGAVTEDKNLAQIESKFTLDSGAGPEKDLKIPKPSAPEIGEYFINWIRRSVKDKSLRVNRADTPVHIVPQGVVLVSPVILKKFCAKMGFDELTGNKATWKVVQTQFHKMKLHIKTDNHVNIHKFQIKGNNRSSFMNGYLLPFNVLFQEGKHPEINNKIQHIG